MQRLFKIVCRGSRLSLAQADIFRKKLLAYDPGVKVEFVIRETQGDANQSLPLHEMEGKDFFTRDIQECLLNGEADFAVHSLKDVSGENFFENNHFAIIERDDPHDVAVFNDGVLEKLAAGDEIVLGTSSPRRESMATGFLSRALPGNSRVIAAAIRGNVDTRLKKLGAREYDGIILACAGLNRLLRADSNGADINELLKGKSLMILPLLSCPPAPGQGAIVAETTPANAEAVNALQALNNLPLATAVDHERKVAHQYGSGCHQRFGVIHMDTPDGPFIFAAGHDRDGREFAECLTEDGSLGVAKNPVAVDSFASAFVDQNILLIKPGEGGSPLRQSGPSQKRIWVAETPSWYELARQGVWVEGSLEGMGLKFSEMTLTSPLLSVLQSKTK